MADLYVKSGSGATQWATSTAYAAGARVVLNRADGGTWALYARPYVFECTTAGTTGASYPTWPLPGNITVDVTTITSGTAVFTARRPGYSSGTNANWSFATIFLDYVINTNNILVSHPTDRIFVSNNHSETLSGAQFFDPSTSFNTYAVILCVDDSAAPPTALATGAVVAGDGITFDHWSYNYGITYRSNNNQHIVCYTASGPFFDNCLLELAGGGSTATIFLQSSHNLIMRNSQAKFSHTSQCFNFNYSSGYASSIDWRGGGLHPASSAITALFGSGTWSASHNIVLADLDLSVAASALSISTPLNFASLQMINCKMPSGWNPTLPVASPQTGPTRIVNCDSGATNYRYRESILRAALAVETTIVKTGGSSDGVTPVSVKVTTDAYARYPQLAARVPLTTMWNESTGSALTATVDIIHDSTTALNNDEVWLEVEYLGSSSSPLGSIASDWKTNPLTTGTAQTTSTATWTTTGLTNPNKQKLETTFTPQMKGPIALFVCVGKPSYTLYADRKPVIA